jgi:hypothetical protein
MGQKTLTERDYVVCVCVCKTERERERGCCEFYGLTYKGFALKNPLMEIAWCVNKDAK